MEEQTTPRSYNSLQLLRELEALSASLDLSHHDLSGAGAGAVASTTRRKNEEEEAGEGEVVRRKRVSFRDMTSRLRRRDEESRGGGSWKLPVRRALSRILRHPPHKLSCLFCVEVAAVRGLPTSMDGQRLTVCVRKKETARMTARTVPSTVSNGAADFGETLFVMCHVYFGGGRGGTRLIFEPRPFFISVFASSSLAETGDGGGGRKLQLELGRSSVDLSQLIQESIDKSFQGIRVRQWDMSINMSSEKAWGGKLFLKLWFQIMEKDDGRKSIEIYTTSEGRRLAADMWMIKKKGEYGPPYEFARRQSKDCFSVSSNGSGGALDSKKLLMLDNNVERMLDEVNQNYDSNVSESGDEKGVEDGDDMFLEFDVVDKGVEQQQQAPVDEWASSSMILSNEPHQLFHCLSSCYRLKVLDSISQRITSLESIFSSSYTDSMSEEGRLDSEEEEEETVTREFIQMLDSNTEPIKSFESIFSSSNIDNIPEGGVDSREEEEIVTREFIKMLEEEEEEVEEDEKDLVHNSDASERLHIFVPPDLGEGLGCVVQTRKGGYLASMDPLRYFPSSIKRMSNVGATTTEAPKLAMQLSQPLVLLPSPTPMDGIQFFRRMAAFGLEDISSNVLHFMPMDDLQGKTAEQIAFEGIASQINSHVRIRNLEEEGPTTTTSNAYSFPQIRRTFGAVMANKRNRSTQNMEEEDEPLTMEELLAFAVQNVNEITIDALKVQAGVDEETAPLDDVSPQSYNSNQKYSKENEEEDLFLLARAVPLPEWLIKDGGGGGGGGGGGESIMICFVVQLRDPLRQYESVGGPMIVHIQADYCMKPLPHNNNIKYDDGEKRYKVQGLNIGGIKVRGGDGGRKGNVWDTEKHRVTAMHWLIEYGLLEKPKNQNVIKSSVKEDFLWSFSSLKPLKNPNVKLACSVN
ncbi:unnamed protein product [Cuscuta epithymum]|uniref:C2 NT-type domain-containing protein n=1 Tax=Cuscuta epithymum TaxID=186058 RepID=A0AAV0CQR1_9ASTE|nr:unnamed protein product [Cuscuta epithymum]